MAKIFKNGKHKGRKAEWVRTVDPNYYRWAIANAPGLIIDDSVPKHVQVRMSSLPPNENFLNEGPHKFD
jgi:hypothetical protein